MLGESKTDIFDLIPKEYLPEYLLISSPEIKVAIDFSHKIGFPLIVKPDIGERGTLVEVIHSVDELSSYHRACTVPYLIQSFVAYPIELGVFYVQMPNESKGRITSIVQKDFLSVTGDGKANVSALLHSNFRAILQMNFDHPRFKGKMDLIPANGEVFRVEGIGNHCRGTTFINANDHITPKLEEAFNTISNEIEGFYFGRFDLRCSSWEKLEELKNFKILELNGAGAEPGHIYHPGASLFAGYRSVIDHLRMLGQVSRANHRKGVPYWTLRQGLNKLKEIKAYNRKIEHLL